MQPVALTLMLHVLEDPARRPRAGVAWEVRLEAPAGYLIGSNVEIVDAVEGTTAEDGLIDPELTPSSEYEFPGAIYRLSWEGRRLYFHVPDVGPADIMRNLRSPDGGLFGGGGAGGGKGDKGDPGRGIASTDYVDGRAVFLYTDGDADSFAIAQGATGPRGLPGLDGSGGPVGTAVSAGQTVLSSGPGTASKFGHITWDFVDRFLADPTGVTDNTAKYETARAAAIAAGGAVLYCPPGIYKFTGTQRLAPVEGGLAIRGDGSGRTTFRFTNINGGLDLGKRLSQDFSGGLANITIDGTNVCRNPLAVYWTLGWALDDVEVIQGGYDAANPDNSCAVFFARTQNVNIFNMRSRNHRHHNVILEDGVGNLRWRGGQIGACGLAGAGGHHLWSRIGPASPLYPSPFLCEFKEMFLEFAKPGQTIMVRLDSAKDFTFSHQFSAGENAPAGLVIMRLNADADGNTYLGAKWNGKQTSPPTPNSSGIIGISVASGAINNRIAGVPGEFSHMATAFYLDAGANFVCDADPGVQKTVAKVKDGPGAARLALNYQTRVDTVPAGSDANRGQEFIKNSLTVSIPDSRSIMKKGSSVTIAPYDYLNSASVREWAASTFYFKGEIVWVSGALRMAKADFTSGATVDLASWDSPAAQGSKATVVSTAVGAGKVIPPGTGYYVATLDFPAAGSGVLTLPTDLDATGMVIRCLSNGTTGVRPWSVIAPSGTTLFPINAGATSGQLSGPTKSDFLVAWSDTAGKILIKATDLGVTTS